MGAEPGHEPSVSAPAAPTRAEPPADTTTSHRLTRGSSGHDDRLATTSRASDRAPAATQAGADNLQKEYQSQLEELGKLGGAKFHFVEYAPPSFALFQDRIVLQLTLRNSLPFEKDAGSIYKRAAQSFDVFLAPLLKDLLEKLPAGAAFQGLDITVLNQFAGAPQASSEAVEFICPLEGLREFAEARITNQDLIDQSVVLVNGVRIALNLQQVE